jgi:hypothetical protein
MRYVERRAGAEIRPLRARFAVSCTEYSAPGMEDEEEGQRASVPNVGSCEDVVAAILCSPDFKFPSARCRTRDAGR